MVLFGYLVQFFIKVPLIKLCDRHLICINLFQFFNQVLILGKAEAELAITRKVYDLIYELYNISPGILLSVLPQLEFKLKSTEESERMGSVSLLARMFSGKDYHNILIKDAIGTIGLGT